MGAGFLVRLVSGARNLGITLFVAVLARRSWATLVVALLRAKPGPRAAGDTPPICAPRPPLPVDTVSRPA